MNLKHGLCEYGIMMGEKSEWGKGYASEASKLVINYCFNKLDIRKITLGVVEENLPAVNLYYRLGFILEGTYKHHVKYDGRYLNTLRMALFNKKFSY